METSRTNVYEVLACGEDRATEMSENDAFVSCLSSNTGGSCRVALAM
jgi:hypothetical protein